MCSLLLIKWQLMLQKNGDDFETIVKSKGDKRFEFLLPWHEYHSYYLFKKHIFSEQKKRENLPQQQIIETASVSDQDNSKDSQDDESKKSKNKVTAPVSFSIKAKDMDTHHLEKKKKTILLLDDDSGEEHEEKQNSDGTKNENKEESIQSVNPIITTEIASSAEAEDKPRKLTQEELEAKLAEEKLKDKLAAAAREKLAQQSRDRQLQLERKRKAALFLNKLKDSGPLDEFAQVHLEAQVDDANNDKSKRSHLSPVSSPSEIHNLRSPFLSLPSSPLPISNENDIKSSSGNKHGDSERLARFLAESGSLSIQKMKSRSRRRSPSPRSHHKHHYSPSRGSSKPKKRSRSKNRSDHKKRSRSRSKSRSHKKRHKSPSKSPSKSKDDRSKTPPAAYSLIRRSKTRSPSPRRYRYGFPVKHKSRRK